MNRRELMLSTASALTATTTIAALELKAESENRAMLVMVNVSNILDAFCGPHQVIAARLTSTPELPDDVIVRGVTYDFQRDSFCFRVTSDEFDPVPPGMVPPAWCGDNRFAYEAIVRRPDGSYARCDR